LPSRRCPDGHANKKAQDANHGRILRKTSWEHNCCRLPCLMKF
jgi:hypothetical protein